MRTSRLAVLVLAVMVLSGCGGAGPGELAPGGLGYGVPSPNPATYTFTDTAVFSIESALGPMRVVTAHAGTAELDYRRWSEDGHVVVRIPEWQATFRNSTQAPVRADASDIGGPFTVRLTPKGGVTVVDAPSLSEAAVDIAGREGLVRPLFVSLPGRPVRPGASWVDTLTTVDEAGGTRSVIRSRITSTLRGDTVVADRRLLLIRTVAENAIEVTGVSGGVEIDQRLTGTTTGTVLWDDDARLLFARTVTGTLTGELGMPGVDVEPMPVRTEIRRTVSLR